VARDFLGLLGVTTRKCQNCPAREAAASSRVQQFNITGFKLVGQLNEVTKTSAESIKIFRANSDNEANAIIRISASRSPYDTPNSVGKEGSASPNSIFSAR
jgi:hypothetical protein